VRQKFDNTTREILPRGKTMKVFRVNGYSSDDGSPSSSYRYFIANSYEELFQALCGNLKGPCSDQPLAPEEVARLIVELTPEKFKDTVVLELFPPRQPHPPPAQPRSRNSRKK
jgi:hypothetical protein